MGDSSKLELQIAELRRNLMNMENENEKLKSTMRDMVDDYTRQLELRDETIYKLEGSQSRVLQKEIGDLQHENRLLKDKVARAAKE